ncbi:MAG: hypothetical protein K5870_06770 [Lachnospiraceae bacterium]|nr:hypothetical protein [Lachnospiraceae bacterium]
MMDYKKCFKTTMIILIAALAAIAILTVVVDPYFHYHKPLFKYRLLEPRYTNDGISRHFDFDSVITGTSMSQNFKCSMFDELFDAKSVKLPLAGAGYEEISAEMNRAFMRNPDIRNVLWVIDYNGLLRKSDWSQYSEYPTYMYDNNYLNDVPYLLNKDILYHGTVPNILMSVSGKESDSMDSYTFDDEPTGASVVYTGRTPRENGGNTQLTDEEKAVVTNTFKDNILSVVNAHPETVFYMYFTPYSICYWEMLDATGQTNKYIEAQKIATEMLLECPNVRLYSFFERTDIICDLDYYRDGGHYSYVVSDMIMEMIADGEGILTKDNYTERINRQREFFTTFDYDGYFDAIEKDAG